MTNVLRCAEYRAQFCRQELKTIRLKNRLRQDSNLLDKSHSSALAIKNKPFLHYLVKHFMLIFFNKTQNILNLQCLTI